MEPFTLQMFSVCLPYLAILMGVDCEAPYYDESETWIIEYYDKIDVDFECYGVNYPTLDIGGCSRLWPNEDGHYKIIMGTMKIFGYQSLSTLEHEILHQMCKCSWHSSGTLKG